MSHEQLLAFNKQRFSQVNVWFERVFSVKAVSLVESLLLERANGWRAKIRSAVGMFLVLLMLVSFFAIVFLCSYSLIIAPPTYKIAVLKYNGGGDWYANLETSLPNLIKFCNDKKFFDLIADTARQK